MSLATAATPICFSDEITRLFPLPLTAMEAFMLYDTTPEYPMMCNVDLPFDGRIDRAAFDAALTVALERAPLFCSVVEYDDKNRPQWVLTDRRPAVDWQAYGTPYPDDYDTYIDLTQELPLRVYVRAGEERSSVLIHMHHCSADGLGCFVFIEDFLAAYANACSAEPRIEMRPFDPARLLTRGNPGVEPARGWRAVAEAWVGLREAIYFFWRRPQPVAPRTPSSADLPGDRRRQQVGYISRTCPDDVAARLRAIAAEQQVTINDILMRDLYITLTNWNQAAPQHYLTILMPQSLREKADDAMPATNRIGFAFVTRRAKWCQRPPALLSSLAAETNAIVQGKLSRYFVDGLEKMLSLGLLNRLLRGSLCFSSAILTNLGNPQRRFVTKLPRAGDGMQVGNLVLTGTTAMPPLRPKTYAAFAITGYSQSFTISLKCDPYRFSRAETEALLALYLEQLAATARGETDN